MARTRMSRIARDPHLGFFPRPQGGTEWSLQENLFPSLQLATVMATSSGILLAGLLLSSLKCHVGSGGPERVCRGTVTEPLPEEPTPM